ncbi:MAG: hypothetical protein QCH35_07995 [Methanomicrobiaceae archaeon]|nr:hypothetical protein [Methanomicrobiaceae archaeon]
MRDARRWEVWVAALLGLVLLAAVLFIHTTVMHPAAPAPAQKAGEERAAVKGGAAEDSGGPGPDPSFSLAVAPAHATARSGETVRYRMAVAPEGGFDAPVSLSLSASALYGTVTETRELGVIDPPYDPVTFDFVAPDLPFPTSSTTIEATVTAAGGGMTMTQKLTLRVTR